MTKQKKLVLIDSHALIHRAYHALPPLSSKSGEVTNAVYGFTTIFLKVLRELKPDYVAAAFDLPAPTFRHKQFAEYKAQRPSAPDDLKPQFGRVREVLDAFSVSYFEKAGFEADDIIGTIADKLRGKKVKVIIVTGDLDTLQLVGDNVEVLTLKKGVTETVTYDEKAVIERYGLKPSQLTNFRGLKGDPSDNIPGVKGIGEKTAASLIKVCGSLEELYKKIALPDFKPDIRGWEKVKEKLIEHKESAFFSKMLSEIRTDTPIDFDLEKCKVREYDKEKISVLFRELGFYRLLERLEAKVAETDFGDTTKTNKEEKTGNVVLDGESKISVYQNLKNSDTPEGGRGNWVFPRAGKQRSARNRGFLESRARQQRAERAPLLPMLDFIKKAESEKLIFINYELEERKIAKINFFLSSSNKSYEVQLRKIEVMKDVLENDEIKKIGWGFKPLMKELKKNFGINLAGIDHDMLIAAYLLNPGRRDYSSEKIKTEEGTDNIFPVFEKRIKKQGLEKVFEEIEIPLLPVLANMELEGIKINKSRLTKMSKIFKEKLAGLEKQIYSLAGCEFNIKSPKQLGEVLFEKMGLETEGIKKTKKEKNISTKASELLKLRGQNEIIDFILEYRELAKLKSTYVDVLPALADENSRVHTTFNQQGTATGRLSSENPNLQNIPARGEYGREIRKAFKAEKGFNLVSFDYSQIELRIAASLADDKKMIRAFLDGKDIHTLTAAEVNDVSESEVTADMRRQAKVLNFGVLYGMSIKGFEEAAGVSWDEAKKFINEYFSDFSGIARWIEETKKSASKNGFVETLSGRKRYLPDINSSNWQIKQAAERMAVNMPVQGLAADIIKLAMIKIADYLSRFGKADIGTRMLLQVHDELVFEITDDTMGEMIPKIKNIMEEVFKLKVPVIVDIKVGDNWGEMKE